MLRLWYFKFNPGSQRKKMIVRKIISGIPSMADI
jgi:hypothetical protein